MGTGLSVNRG